MKLYGDVPPEQRKLAEELVQTEYDITAIEDVPPEFLAKCYTCLAHDWYQMSMEEQGERLLEKADQICPDYFTSTVKDHMASDPSFDLLVKSLSQELGQLYVDGLTAVIAFKLRTTK